MLRGLQLSREDCHRLDNPAAVVDHLMEVLWLDVPAGSGRIQLNGSSGPECAGVTLQRTQERERVES